MLCPRYHPNIIGHILKNNKKNKGVCIHEIIRTIVLKMKMKMKNRSHIYDRNLDTKKNRPRSRHGRNHSKYKMCLTMMMSFYEHVRNI